MNKIGLHMGYWWGSEAGQDVFRMLDLTSRAGLEVFEINPAWFLRMTGAECRDFRRRAEDYGLTVTLNGGFKLEGDISADSEATRRAGIEFCVDVLNRAPELGAATWSGLIYSAWTRMPRPESVVEEEKARAREFSKQSLGEILPVAERAGVDYCFEVVNRYEQFLFNTAAEAVAFAEEVGSPRAKVHLDSFHMNIEEDDMFDAVALAGRSGRLAHFHVSESNRRVPGLGPTNINWPKLGKALRSAGYRGAVVMEPFVNPGAVNAKGTRTWRDLSGGADLDRLVDDVRRGGEFLRGIMAAA
ncbi:MAG: sugar phosphate isomerase/epimerase [Planctomycetota bacterium]|jgi:D-psicose/D-tagatose/L-ribulose 3-epimerase|nr:sugar phosphate isomerase/epimerase [Planctomycetota bacterium]